MLSIGFSFLIHECIEKPLLKIPNLRDLFKIIGCLYVAIFLLYSVATYRSEVRHLKIVTFNSSSFSLIF